MGKRGEGSGWSQGRIREAETPSFYSKSGRGHPSPSGGQHIPENLGEFTLSSSSAAWSLTALAGRAPPTPTCPRAPRCLSPPAKGRAISLPMDLDAHISSLLSSGTSCIAAAQRNASNYKATTRAFPRVTPTANQWDYKNIIEKLQVGAGLPGVCHDREARLHMLP